MDLEKDRYKLTDKKYDFTIIEILKDDNVTNYLKINKDPYKEKDEIFSYQYAGGVQLGFSFGKIIKLYKDSLEYDVATKKGSSGCPIISTKNSQVLGLHRGAIYNNEEKINFGTPIEFIINQISYIRCKYEIKDYNEIQIINNKDGFEVNKEIEFKINLLNGGKKDNIIPRKKFNKIGINTVYFAINDKINNMSFLFNNCSSLKEIYFNSFETDITTNMKAMFQNCSNLENLDLSNFNTSKVTNMAQMFKGCSKLKEIKGIDKFNTINVSNMKEMFN